MSSLGEEGMTIMPWSRGYGDITAMYICRSEIPSCIYAKHQYMHQSMKICSALYISTCEYNYKVITRCDTILQEDYITDRRKCENTQRYTSMNSTKGAHNYRKKTQETSKGPGRIEPQTVCRWSTLPLRHSDQQPGESTSFKLQDLDMKI